MAPAEAYEVVAHGNGQIAHLAVSLGAKRTVAFGQFCAVGSVDERHVRPLGGLPTHQIVDLRLSGGVGEVVNAADNVCDSHVVVIDNDCQIVSWGAVRAQDDEVIQVLVGVGDFALDVVFDDGFTLIRGANADCIRRVGGGLHWRRGRAMET